MHWVQFALTTYIRLDSTMYGTAWCHYTEEHDTTWWLLARWQKIALRSILVMMLVNFQWHQWQLTTPRRMLPHKIVQNHVRQCLVPLLCGKAWHNMVMIGTMTKDCIEVNWSDSGGQFSVTPVTADHTSRMLPHKIVLNQVRQCLVPLLAPKELL